MPKKNRVALTDAWIILRAIRFTLIITLTQRFTIAAR